jgi:nucleoside-diphosphate-sugar epimerase
VNTALQPPVLVTGGTGFVGSHLVEKLVDLSVPVRCLIRRSSSLRYLPAEKVELVYGDLATGEGLAEAAAGAGTIFHVAGVTKAFSREAYFEGNLHGAVNLLRAASAGAARFIYVSTLAAVGPSPDGRPLTEDAPPRPLTWYGQSKLEAERAVRASPLAARAVIVRPPVVYGPRDTDVFEVFRSVSQGLMLTIGRAESYFSYIHAADLAEALLAAACAEAAPGATYFAANPDPVSWTAFARAIAAALGRSVRCLSIPGPLAYAAGWCAEMAAWLRGRPGILSRQKVIEGRCRYWVCDAGRARAELGFRAGRSLEAGIRETVAWYKDAGWI